MARDGDGLVTVDAGELRGGRGIVRDVAEEFGGQGAGAVAVEDTGGRKRIVEALDGALTAGADPAPAGES